ncbi:MAG: hypothetical protein ACH346_07830, partial [Chthoniobacterales bacterium]
MKKPLQIFVLIIFLSLIWIASLSAQSGRLETAASSSATLTSTSNFNSHIEDVSVVTASDYCDFLNNVATESDSDHLYNEAMTSDPTTACIARVGTPGRWHYEVIAGQENCPINYVSDLARISCADRLQVSSSTTSTSTFNSHIEDVSCNNDTFEVEVPSTMLTLVSSSFPTSTSTSTSNVNSYITDVSS